MITETITFNFETAEQQRRFRARLNGKALPMPREKTNADMMRLWRKLADINTAEAGKRLGLSPRSIEDIEQGRSRDGDVLTRLGLDALIHDAAHERDCREAAMASLREREKKSRSRKNPS